ncbi:uncharacterized protein LOC115877417 isoform X1 [Sitophilus oryzae]|uniref:Uncharacterized protein LOC115877417 isoform X1 n=1 Tax=Sitophilus oryzae TaxID=7048 RepID=A0A6J2XEP8_SITOR|nr:uncharacterized protein LOC115877417 isoform X1 [Sitophilus oryzae]
MATMGMVKLPPDFDLQGQNAAGEWKFWKTAFEDYLVAIGQDKAAGLVKLSILRNIIGTESARIMSTFVIPEDQQDKYEYMLELITKYVNPRINECFERYNFLKRVQKEGETFEHFLTECRHLVKSCNYNTLDPNQTSEDKALRDKIVMGIRDPTTREALLRLDELTLDKTINFCRTSEQSRNQSIKFQEGEEEVNFIKKYKKPGEKKRQKSEQQDAKDKFKCKRCQNMHGPRECPAYGKKCRKCGLLNHFAISCRIKNVKNVEEKCDTSEENLFVGNISKDLPSNKSNSTSNSYRNPTNIWEEFIHVENKRYKVKIQYDKMVRRYPFEYKKGDKVVIRSNIDKIWYKATILEKANEPRSYWVRKEDNNRIVRRNTSQIKLSFTEPEKKVLTEPELFPELLSIPNMSSNPIMSLNPHVSVEQNENVNVDLRNKVIKSRSGRNIKPPRKLDL